MNRFILVVCFLVTWCISAHGGQVVPKCDESHVAINHETKVKCYPKVQLQDKCLHDQQCKAITPYSICDSNQSGDDDDKESVCQCRKGFIATGQQDACIPKKSCSMKSDNGSTGTNQTNEYCSSNQFCQNGVCLCLPNYEFNELGQCVLTEQDEEDKSMDFSDEEEDKGEDKEEDKEEGKEKDKEENDQEEYYYDQEDDETNDQQQKNLSPEDSSIARLKQIHNDLLNSIKHTENSVDKLDDIKRNLNKQDDNFRFFRYALILMCLMIVFLFVVIFLIQTRTIHNRNDQTATIRHDHPPRYSEHLKHQYLPVNTQ